MSEIPVAIVNCSIKQLNENTDYSEFPDGLDTERGIEVLVIPEEDGKTAYEWKRCIVVQHGKGCPFAYRSNELLYRVGPTSWVNYKPEGWDKI